MVYSQKVLLRLTPKRRLVREEYPAASITPSIPMFTSFAAVLI